MTWSGLRPGIRGAILALALIVFSWIVWAVLVSPVRSRATAAQNDLQTAEARLEQMEREIEGIAPASDAERRAWQTSQEELLSRLGPETELPLLLESVTRLSESQGVQLFMTSEAATAVGAAGQPREGGDAAASRAQRVLSGVPGARYVPLKIRIYGEYAPSTRFIARLGRLGWIMEVVSLNMHRSFPEVVSDLRVNVYFRASTAEGGGGLDVAGAPEEWL